MCRRLAEDLTTRAWLHEYLTSRDTTFGKVKPLPPDYVAPE
jgi:hypothetical protein